MPFFDILLTVEESDNIHLVEPNEGRTWVIRLRCGSCGEAVPNMVHVDPSETAVDGAGEHEFIMACPGCRASLRVDVVPGSQQPCVLQEREADEGDNEAEAAAALKKKARKDAEALPVVCNGVVLLECRGAEPVEVQLDAQWSAVSLGGERFTDVDLSGDWADYAERTEEAVCLSGAAFEIVRATKDKKGGGGGGGGNKGKGKGKK